MLMAYPLPSGPIDIVGAGDSTSAGIACAVATGASLTEAAAFGNLVASITIRRLGTTGTASPAQVSHRGIAAETPRCPTDRSACPCPEGYLESESSKGNASVGGVAQWLEQGLHKANRREKTLHFAGFLHFRLHPPPLATPASGCNRV